MKDNIESDKIFNRKIIIELRFKAIPKFLDLKGTLISEIDDLEILKNSRWALGDSGIKVSDDQANSSERTRIQVEFDKLSYVSTKIDSINDYFSKFEKLYKVLQKNLGNLDIFRIGCRIQGTYKTQSSDYNSVLNSFQSSFPSSVFLDGYPVNDLKFQLMYQNGMYQIGPIKENDSFLTAQFPYEERINKIGIGIDTDNYLVKIDSDSINGISKIKDVFIASLSVEKSLLDNMGEF